MKKLLLPFLVLLFACSEEDPALEFPLKAEEKFSSEIFFSEYIEGTSFNKALEIVNLTGITIDLEAEAYSLKKQQNGSGEWMSELMLTGEIVHNDIFVISNESATIPEIIEQADQLKTGSPLDFNGNDPIGLFKDGELIDIIGTFNDSEEFAKDQTLRRKKAITEPSKTYNSQDWEVLKQDTVNDLGKY
ncbi:hypothetical protein [Salegentibacter sediminis]|uniref:hypothetical protein n=1 Tax=Salegentibacter sediminis TaxID=1930251 RepID=UPI0009C1254A|nr:hypothetical protein [Salegentibacter sediminis]